VRIILPPGKDTRLLMSISVRESYWNQGIGRKLIQGAVKKARETGMKKVEIGTGNPGVVQMLLYQECGFRIAGVEFDYFRKDRAEKIIKNGIECRDMVRMGMHLDEEMR
jgi:GNAT superfamily N-acetyltransferase